MEPGHWESVKMIRGVSSGMLYSPNEFGLCHYGCVTLLKELSEIYSEREMIKFDACPECIKRIQTENVNIRKLDEG